VPEDPDTLEDDVLENLTDGKVVDTPKQVVVSKKLTPTVNGQTAPNKAKQVRVPKVPKKQKVGRKGRVKLKDLPVSGKPEATMPGTSEELASTDDEGVEESPPDTDIMYEAECILKQRTRKGGKKEFLVRWVDKDARDTWTKESDLSDALFLHWWTSHTRAGTKRKGMNISLISAPGAWAYRRNWTEGTLESTEDIDQFGNAL